MVDELFYLAHRTRQHHALEHATLQLLSQRVRDRYLSGYSDPFGFTVFGEVDEENLRRAVGDALVRLQAGEKKLAIHPNCGTNLVTTAVLVTITALTVGRNRNLFERFAMLLLWILPMLVVGKALGMYLQRFTTDANVHDRWVAEIFPVQLGMIQVHRVVFE